MGNPRDEGRAADERRDSGTARPGHGEARAELRDREAYHAELRFAVHRQNRSIPVSGGATEGSLTKTGGADESWHEMVARFGDAWM